MENKTISWERDVLVGLIKNKHQLDVLLRDNFYHIPEKLLTKSPESLRYITIYMSKKKFESESGIKFLGKIIGFRRVERREIEVLPRPNCTDIYIIFDVEWEELPKKIKAKGMSPAMSTFTTEFLVRNSRYFPELYIQNADELNIYVALCKASKESRKRNTYVKISTINTDRIVAMVEGMVLAVHLFVPPMRSDTVSLWWFYRDPYSFFQKLKSLGVF